MIDFLGIGAQKSGTSWVYACLYEHPEICSPIKEIHFFSRPRFVKGKAWYASHFNKCETDQKKGEFSTSYLYSKEAPERIKKLYPDVKLIAIVRNPVDRAFSQYRNAIKAGEIEPDRPFSEYVKAERSCIEQGKYAEQLARYYKHFSQAQVLILVYEDSKQDPAQFIKKIYHFLEVDDSFCPSMLHRTINVARTPKSVGLDRLMHIIAESLRKTGLDRVVWLVKKSGLTDVIRSVNTSHETRFDDTTTADPYRDELRHDAAQLSEMIGRDMIKEWQL